MYKALIAILLIPFSLQAFSGGGWTPYQEIESIIIESPNTKGTALIVLKGGVSDANRPTGCDAVYNTVSLEGENGRGILSVALSAKMAGQPVRLALAYDESGTCGNGRPTIMSIWL